MQKRGVYLAVLVSGALIVGAAGAQPQFTDFNAPQPPRIDLPEGKSLLGIVAGIMVGGLVLVASMIPSKRGHQD